MIIEFKEEARRILKKKYYAVKKGRKTGVFTEWTECKKQIDGFSGAIYKSFESSEEAEKYLIAGNYISDKSADLGIKSEKTEIIAYVDGSFSESQSAYSYGVVLIIDGKEKYFNERFDNDSEMLSMRNVAGEISGARKAMEYCLENGYNGIVIYHDYEGIARWCTGEWKANKKGTKEYKKYYDSVKESINIRFEKVKGHSGDKYNDLADELAKSALNDLKKTNTNSSEKTGYSSVELNIINKMIKAMRVNEVPDETIKEILISFKKL